MQRLPMLTLIVSTIAFDLFVVWAVTFTLSWGGKPALSAVGFWLFAASPLVVTAYCVWKSAFFSAAQTGAFDVRLPPI